MNGKPGYFCRADLGACGKVGIQAKDLEADLLGRLLARLDGDRQSAPAAPDGDAAAELELAKLEAVARELREAVGRGELALAENRDMVVGNDRAQQAARSRLTLSLPLHRLAQPATKRRRCWRAGPNSTSLQGGASSRHYAARSRSCLPRCGGGRTTTRPGCGSRRGRRDRQRCRHCAVLLV